VRVLQLVPPLIGGLLSGIEVMGTELIPGIITLGTLLGASVSAFVVQYGIDRFYPKK